MLLLTLLLSLVSAEGWVLTQPLPSLGGSWEFPPHPQGLGDALGAVGAVPQLCPGLFSNIQRGVGLLLESKIASGLKLHLHQG